MSDFAFSSQPMPDPYEEGKRLKLLQGDVGELVDVEPRGQFVKKVSPTTADALLRLSSAIERLASAIERHR